MALDDTSNIKALQESVENLEDFSKQLKLLLKDFKGNRVVARETKNHQKQLEKLLNATNNIIKKTATDQEKNGFGDLISQTELSYKILKDSHKNDKKFQQEFVKTFGDVKDAGTVQNEVLKKISLTMSDVGKAVNVVNKQAMQDVQDTAMTFLTGPFGRMAKDAIDVSGIKEIFTRSGGTKSDVVDDIQAQYQSTDSSIKGMFHDGITNVPSEGSYLLNKGERVVAPKDNGRLSDFLDSVSTNGGNNGNGGATKKMAVPVIITDTFAGFFDSLIDHDEENSIDELTRNSKWHKETMAKFDFMAGISARLPLGYIQKHMLINSIMLKRFERHPIAFTLDTIAKTLGSTLQAISKITGISWVFGKITDVHFGTEAKDDTSRIVQSNKDIVDQLRLGTTEDRRGLFTRKIFDPLGDVIKNAIFGSEFFKPRYKTETSRAAKVKGSVLEMQMLDFARITSVNTAAIASQILDDDTRKEWLDALNVTKDMSRKQLSILEDIEKGVKSGKGGGILGFIMGKGKILAGVIIGSLMTGLVAAGGALLTFGATAVSWLVSGITAAASTGFAAAAGSIIAAIGAGLAVGGLIGTYIVNPLLEAIDSTFGTSIIDTIGGIMVRLVAWMEENIPFVKSITGGEASATLQQEKKNEEAMSKIRDKTNATTMHGKIIRAEGTVPSVPVNTENRVNMINNNINEDSLAAKIGKYFTNSQNNDTNNQTNITTKPAVEDLGTYAVIQGQ